MLLPSRIPFASLLHYSPRGTSKAALRSRNFTITVKRDGQWQNKGSAIDYAVELLKYELPNYPALHSCFGQNVWLVPAPKSHPLQPNSLWPTLRLCDVMSAAGLAIGVRPILTRVDAVQKSATAAPGQRPTPTIHYNSIAVHPDPAMTAAGSITVVDDVVTKGATFVACYARLRQAYPATPIHCFALARTISVGDVDKVLGPVAGEITCQLDHASRLDQ